MGRPAPFLYTAWVGASMVLVPFAAMIETRKLRRAGVTPYRAHEKLGHGTQKRKPDGQLVWFHAASVGESLSVLALIRQMGQRLSTAQFLITSGTATSAKLLQSRLPPRTDHQFAPLDAPGPVKRFLKRWQPDAAIFVESELWPQLLRRTHASGTKMALVNARLSSRSIARWQKQPKLAQYLLGVFQLILTQNDAMAEAMVNMHAPPDRVARGINLKSMAGPLPIDEDALFDARAAIGHRPVWVASSTHEGEEEVVLEAHKNLLKNHPDLCLILAPRHPERGDAVAKLIEGSGLSYTRRTSGEWPDGQVFLADTMGELGLWYALTDCVFLGGSLRPIGGHNPYEVAHSGAVVLSGPHVPAFLETYEEMWTNGAAMKVDGANALAASINELLTDPDQLQRAKKTAKDFALNQADALEIISDRLIKALELER